MAEMYVTRYSKSWSWFEIMQHMRSGPSKNKGKQYWITEVQLSKILSLYYSASKNNKYKDQ